MWMGRSPNNGAKKARRQQRLSCTKAHEKAHCKCTSLAYSCLIPYNCSTCLWHHVLQARMDQMEEGPPAAPHATDRAPHGRFQDHPSRGMMLEDTAAETGMPVHMIGLPKPGLTLKQSSDNDQPANLTSASQVHRVSFPRFCQQVPNRTVLLPKRRSIQPGQAAMGGLQTDSPASAVPEELGGASAQLQQPSSTHDISPKLASTCLDPQTRPSVSQSAVSGQNTAGAHVETPQVPPDEMTCITPKPGGSQGAGHPPDVPQHRSAQGQADTIVQTARQQAHSAGLRANEQLALRWRIGYKR